MFALVSPFQGLLLADIRTQGGAALCPGLTYSALTGPRKEANLSRLLSPEPVRRMANMPAKREHGAKRIGYDQPKDIVVRLERAVKTEEGTRVAGGAGS